MPLSKEDFRIYMLRRYHQRRNDAISFLGGKCVDCGTTEGLQFDHIDRSKKSFWIARMWNVAKARFWEEVRKCQLLCQDCHTNKTLRDLGRHRNSTVRVAAF